MQSVHSKQEIWKRHVASAGMHPGGVSGYCQEAGINISGFYQWRKKLLLKKRGRRASGSFVSVVAPDPVQITRDFSRPDKIDAKWVGQMLASFVRELS